MVIFFQRLFYSLAVIAIIVFFALSSFIFTQAAVIENNLRDSKAGIYATSTISQTASRLNYKTYISVTANGQSKVFDSSGSTTSGNSILSSVFLQISANSTSSVEFKLGTGTASTLIPRSVKANNQHPTFKQGIPEKVGNLWGAKPATANNSSKILQQATKFWYASNASGNYLLTGKGIFYEAVDCPKIWAQVNPDICEYFFCCLNF